MKKLLILTISLLLLLSGCSSSKPDDQATKEDNDLVSNYIENIGEESVTELESNYVSEVGFKNLNDPNLLKYIEDSIYSTLETDLSNENFVIENVEVKYVSKEYIEEVDYNSQSNIFFGYTLAELDEQFEGTKYVFTLGDDGTTVVKAFEDYDDTYEKALKNVAIGAGVIIVCVTVSAVTAGAGLAPVSMVFAASAKTATTMALSSGVIGGVSAGVVEGFKTKDFDAALKAAALAGSEGFKWGAISGAIAGGVSEVSKLRGAAKAVEGGKEYAKGTVEIAEDLKDWQKAELRALNDQGGFEQLSYLNGKQVPFGTEGATRPDVVRIIGDHIEAVEVKYYDLESPQNRYNLYKELIREVTDRVAHLPKGSTQRVILDVTGRGYSESLCNEVAKYALTILEKIDKSIVVEIVGLV